ncbi:MAG: HAD-IIB family hydrolase, partial [Candidatus Binatia bacterium]
MIRLVVITDLDGTLLDQETYSYEASLPAIRRLLSLHIPLILCSSKTSSEIVALWEELGLRDPFISENGGAIYLPPNYFRFPVQGARPKGPLETLELGTDISTLRGVLAETARQCRVRIRSFGAMSPDEVSLLTGLSRN